MGSARGLERAQEGRIEEKGGREGRALQAASAVHQNQIRQRLFASALPEVGRGCLSLFLLLGRSPFVLSLVRWPDSDVGEREDIVINDVLCCASRRAATT